MTKLTGHFDLDCAKKNYSPPPSVFAGDVFSTKEGYLVTVVEYFHAKKILVEFNDSRKTQIYVEAVQLRRGTLSNPNHPKTLGVGFMGIGPYVAKRAGKMTKEYTLWFHMLQRSTDEGRKSSSVPKAYHDKSTDPQWHNFQEFAEWCQWQVGFKNSGWELDKDLLVKHNKVYSPDTCVFLPNEVNCFLIRRESVRGDNPIGVHYFRRDGYYLAQGSFGGAATERIGEFKTSTEAFLAYKERKEWYANILAEKYKGQIDERAYISLLNFEVDVDD